MKLLWCGWWHRVGVGLKVRGIYYGAVKNPEKRNRLGVIRKTRWWTFWWNNIGSVVAGYTRADVDPALILLV